MTTTAYILSNFIILHDMLFLIVVLVKEYKKNIMIDLRERFLLLSNPYINPPILPLYFQLIYKKLQLLKHHHIVKYKATPPF